MAINNRIFLFLKRNKELVLDILIIFLVGLLSVFWFKGNNLIGGGDFGMPLDWIKQIKSLPWFWNEDYSFGAHDSRSIAFMIPMTLINAFLQWLGFSLYFIEKITFYFIFVGGGISMYCLCLVLGIKRIGKMFASLFYMLNPFSLIIIWHISHAYIQIPYSFAPLFLGLYIYGLKGKKNFRYWLLFSIIWLLTTTSAYVWPAAAVIHWLPIAFFLAIYLIRNPKDRLFALKSTVMFGVFWLLINAYWFFPFTLTISQSMESARSSALISDIDTLKLTSVKLPAAIRMMGFWSLHSGYRGEPYYTYEAYYRNQLVVAASWLIPVLVVVGLRKKFRDKTIFYFSVALIAFGLYGMSGPTLPLGDLLLGLYRKIPALALLTRFNFLFFGIPTFLVFSYLMAEGIDFIYEIGKKHWKELVYAPLSVISVALLIVLVFPFWNGQVIRSEGPLFPGERFEVPEYWWEAGQWLSSQTDYFRVLPLPMSKTYNVAMDWGEGYSGGDMTRWILPQPPVNVGTVPGFEVAGVFAESLEKKIGSFDYARLLGYLNVKYLILREDTRWSFILGHNWWYHHQPENLQTFFDNQKILSLEKTIGKLKFYRLQDRFLLPHFYFSDQIAFIDSPVEGLVDVAGFLRPEEKEAFILAEDLTDQNLKKQFLENNLISQNIIRVNPGLSEGGAVYSFKVESEGEYEIFLGSDDVSNNNPGKVKWQLDGGQTIESGIRIENGLLSFGSLFLKEGEHTIGLFLSPPVNLINNSSFEENIPGIDQYSSDAYGGERSLRLVSTGQNQLISIPAETFKAGKDYEISLVTKNINGGKPVLVIWENYTDRPTPNLEVNQSPFGPASLETSYSTAQIPSGKEWQRSQINYRPNLFARKFGLVLANPPQSENLFDNVEIKKIFDKPLILRKEIQKEFPTVPNANFEKINPTEYKGEIGSRQEPGLLVFSDAFHPGWQINSQAPHFKVNGFANGWLILPEDSNKISIRYAPQKMLFFACAVSISAFVGALVVLVFGKKRSE